MVAGSRRSLGAGVLWACAWDQDTLAIEAKGLPEVVDAITGRFDRYPPLYYEMRRDRVKKELKSDPATLALYDDIGVACDRLGESDSAIMWMERKREQLDQREDSEHEYRYYANLGTFHAHRWFRSGADLDDREDIRVACELIAKAIEINPDAHFGREKYQLMALEWIRDDPREISVPDSMRDYYPTFLRDQNGHPFAVTSEGGGRHEEASQEMIDGLVGLITLGAAWESVDVHMALAVALELDGRVNMAHFVDLRVRELLEHGQQSILPDFGYGHQFGSYTSSGWKAYFPEARQMADQWLAHKQGFMVERLSLGMHPDTHPDFWLGYRDLNERPDYPFEISYRQKTWGMLLGVALVSLTILVLLVAFAVWLGRRHWRSRTPPLEHPA